MIDGFVQFLEQEPALLNSEKQTQVFPTVCWVTNNIRNMKNRAQWHPKSDGNVSLQVQQSMAGTVVGNAWWYELILRKQHGEGLRWSWTGSLGALRFKSQPSPLAF